jgi:prolyl oligopeptidase
MVPLPLSFHAPHLPYSTAGRYSKLLAGASWMGEYGDPDKPEEWAFLEQYSPYHNVDPKTVYPPTLFTTSTRDDRVHPAHARKLMQKLRLQQDHNMWYYENIEGGHGGAADNKQRAFMTTLVYDFLWKTLSKAKL